jgi:ankyrin repeat protein
MLAASHGHANVTKALLAAGADTRIRNNKRDRARDIAELAGNTLEQHENSKSWLK